MSDTRKIKSALVSVFHKEGLDEIVAAFIAQGVSIYSTGGTAEYMRRLGAEVNEVADLTQYPSILEGRVKTLHPKVFGGILARRDAAGHVAEMEQYEIPPIDAVIVDLYPFEETVASGADEAAIIEKIDIGGIALIRAAAKNFNDVVIVPSAKYYGDFAQIMAEAGGQFTRDQRRWFAARAFDVSSHYDSHIYRYMAGPDASLKVSEQEVTVLRYGENPHQQGRFYGDLSGQFEQLSGKALSYNNLVDIDATVQLVDEFSEPVFAIIKHTNPCGLATGANTFEAWTRAIECDPLSAFGGILCTNGTLDLKTAEAIHELFYEVLIADEFEPAALELLRKKKQRILLKRVSKQLPKQILKTALNGFLVQDKDDVLVDPAEMEVKSSRKPTNSEWKDIVFGEIAVKHLKSNAIAVVKNQQLIGSGMGQTSRVDALKQAIIKARERGFDPSGSVLASDAFFPFSDSAENALENGIEVIVQPGGSRRDEDTIKFCENNNMCLIFNGIRHFKH